MGAHREHGVWEAIAHSFDRNRTRTWPHVERYLASLAQDSRVLDLMGGNGRHTRSILGTGLPATWLDWSRPAARIVAQRYPGAAAVVGDATRLPLRDASFDACIYVAGLHSLPSPAARVASLAELRRVLRPGATAQVTVWSRDAPRFRPQGPAGEPLDVVLPWRSDGHDEPRTYHLYTPATLDGDLQKAGFEVLALDAVAVVAPEPDNLVAVVRRP
ncbi:MAG TPA: methyltransferase domain-containing protein [Candidatus Thermoplasmatota archaeon]|nr:methyltransferase domain-containing protein [Candidatus Thermoplasmatota archaeon]